MHDSSRVDKSSILSAEFAVVVFVVFVAVATAVVAERPMLLALFVLTLLLSVPLFVVLVAPLALLFMLFSGEIILFGVLP